MTLFSGIPEQELEEAFARLELRRYAAGAVLIAEGDLLDELYILRTGSAEVLVADRRGEERSVARVSAGASIGEMSLLTAQPAVSTVRAAEDVALFVVTKDEFDRLAARFPQVYRNVGAILADRLARTNRLTLAEEPGRLSLLLDRGAPPELSYAIAASVAWHTREPTLLLIVDKEPPELVAAVALDATELVQRPVRREASEGVGGAYVALLDTGQSGQLGDVVRALRGEYDHVLVAMLEEPASGLGADRTVELRAPQGGSPPAGAAYAVEAWASGPSRIGPDRLGVIRTPELDADDREALAKGVLPASGAAGRTIGWIGRDLGGRKVGVALGAGSVRGFTHFGVLRLLERVGIQPDFLAGTSVGAAAGGLYALGNSPDEAAEIFLRCGPTLFRPRISTRSFLSNRAFTKFIRGMAPETMIEDLPIPFAAVAADIDSQREVVFRRGLLWPAVVASISIPGIYPALRMGPYTIVDGGVLNPVPVSVCADMGADVVIGVKLGPQTAETDLEAESVPAVGRAPSAIPTILRSIEMMQGRLAPEVIDANAVIITTADRDVATGSLRSFKRGIELVADGEAAAEAALPRIAAAVPWARR